MRRRSGEPRTLVEASGWALELRGDEIADIGFGGVPLLRAIRPVLRDRDWNTVPVRVVAQEVTAWSVTSTLAFDDGAIVAEARLSLQVGAGLLHVGLDLTFGADCETNRAGLVVLHRPDDAGTRVDVRHSDGSVEHGRWPTTISPHQPFRDIAGFAWERDGLRATLDLSGDVFENEDQRNWTDASFKTYSTPLARPFPVQQSAGATVHQEARLAVAAGAVGTHTGEIGAGEFVQAGTPAGEGETAPGAGSATSNGPGPAVAPDIAPTQVRPGRSAASGVYRGRDDDVLTVSDKVVGEVPPLSLGAALYPPPPSLAALAAEAGLYDSVLVELTGDDAHWANLLVTAHAQAEALGAGLDVRLVTDDPHTVERWVRRLPPGVVRMAAFDPVGHLSTPPLVDALWATTRDAGLDAEVLVGTRAYFTELNRRIDDLPSGGDAVTFSLTPQMHASEIPHLLDSLAMQRLVARDAARLAAGRPLRIGPITLARRFNAVATSGPVDPATEAHRGTDPLLDTAFAAAWTLASVSALGVDAVAGLCFYETAGPRGITDAAGRKPVGDVLRHLAHRRGRPLLRTHAPADLATLATRNPDGHLDVLVADLSGHPRTVTVTGIAPTPLTLDLQPFQTRAVG